MLSQTLTAFHDAVSLLLRGQVERRNVLEGLDLVLLAADETVDDGWVFFFFQFDFLLAIYSRFISYHPSLITLIALHLPFSGYESEKNRR